MAPSKNNKTAPRASVAHKLAKYVRSNPVHLQSKPSTQKPSLSHLTLGGPLKKRLRNNANTWYPADDETAQHKRNRKVPRPSAGRQSIQAGNVVILLSGKHRGRRVIVLKSLESGNLLVTGPYAVNGVPLKRVNPAYVIATSTKVSLEGVKANVDDSFFKQQKKWCKCQLKNASEQRLKRVEESKQGEEKWRAEAKNVQKTVDAALLNNVKKTVNLKGYLGTRFTLYNNTKPHELKF